MGNSTDVLNSPYSLFSFMAKSRDHWSVKDLDCNYLYVNEPAIDYYNFEDLASVEGRSDKEIPARQCQELWPEFIDHDQRVMKENRSLSSITIHYFGKDNQHDLIPTLCKKSPLLDDEQVVGVIAHAIQLDAPALLYYMNRLNRQVLTFDAPDKTFSAKELEIAFWAQQRLSSKAIAKRLNLSHRTVENRLCVMYQKAGVNSLSQFIDYCKMQGLDNYIPANFIRKGCQLLV